MMRVLFLGDVVAQPGRAVIRAFVPELRKTENLTYVIANGENAINGRGIDERGAQELFESGVDLITSGNHIWDKKEVIDYFRKNPLLIRPANYPEHEDFPTPGTGYLVLGSGSLKLGVINLMGRVHMEPLDCPFTVGNDIITHFQAEDIRCILVDFHAEASSEKQAFAHYVAGRVSAVVGTHTHVQTADERILTSSDGGRTAYITDVGMNGPYDSVIGMQKERSIRKFITRMPQRYEPAEKGAGLHGVIIDIDEETGNAVSIRRIQKFLGD